MIKVNPEKLKELETNFEKLIKAYDEIESSCDISAVTAYSSAANSKAKEYKDWVLERAEAFVQAESNNTTLAEELGVDHSSSAGAPSVPSGSYNGGGTLTGPSGSSGGSSGGGTPSTGTAPVDDGGNTGDLPPNSGTDPDTKNPEIDPDPVNPGLEPEDPKPTPVVIDKKFIFDLLTDILRDLILDHKLSPETKAKLDKLYEGIKALSEEQWKALQQDIELLKEMHKAESFEEFLKAVSEKLKDKLKIPEDGKLDPTMSYIVGLIAKIAAGGDDAKDARAELEAIYNKIKELKDTEWKKVLDNFDILELMKNSKNAEELIDIILKKYIKDEIIGFDILDLLKNYTGTEEQKAQLKEIYEKLKNLTDEQWENIKKELNLAELIGEFKDFDKLIDQIKDGSILKDTYLGELYEENKELITGVIGSLISDLSISDENKAKLEELVKEQWNKIKEEIDVKGLKKILKDFNEKEDAEKLVKDIEALIKDTKLEELYKDNKELVTGVIEAIASEMPDIDEELKEKFKKLALEEWKDIQDKLNLVELMEEFNSIDKLVEAIKEGPLLEKIGLKDLYEENKELVTGTIETIVSDVLVSKDFDEAKAKLEVYYKRLSGLSKAGWEELNNELELLTKFKDSESLQAFLDSREWLLSALMGIKTEEADQAAVEDDGKTDETLKDSVENPEDAQTNIEGEGETTETLEDSVENTETTETNIESEGKTEEKLEPEEKDTEANQAQVEEGEVNSQIEHNEEDSTQTEQAQVEEEEVTSQIKQNDEDSAKTEQSQIEEGEVTSQIKQNDEEAKAQQTDIGKTEIQTKQLEEQEETKTPEKAEIKDAEREKSDKKQDSTKDTKTRKVDVDTTTTSDKKQDDDNSN